MNEEMTDEKWQELCQVMDTFIKSITSDRITTTYQINKNPNIKALNSFTFYIELNGDLDFNVADNAFHSDFYVIDAKYNYPYADYFVLGQYTCYVPLFAKLIIKNLSPKFFTIMIVERNKRRAA